MTEAGDREADGGRRRLRLLMVEDSDADARLLETALEDAGVRVSCRRVDTLAALDAALDAEPWDVILADYYLPGFIGLDAWRRVQARGLDVPFILVSGTIGEERAVEAMRAGVHDYVIKDRLQRLAPAIERELREAEVRARRREFEVHLHLADRLMALGTLAAGVAHEIKNPLTYVIANLELAHDELDAHVRGVEGASLGDVQRWLREARDGAGRVRLIARDVQTFAHGHGGAATVVDLRRVLEATVRMTWHEIRGRASLVQHYAELPMVRGTDAGLGQVFLNLVVNALQAIPVGEPGRNAVRIGAWTDPEGRAVVEVGDTGPGIPPATLGQIFQPFFTTKAPGEGTGLGLSITHRIVTSLGGTITVQSEPVRGTVFRVTLPASEGRPGVSSDFPGRRGRVLVVDDDPVVGSVVERTLLSENDVVVVTGGAEALREMATEPGFDAIVCDLMMPGMSGVEFHAEVLARTPALADMIAFVSGGTSSPETLAFLARVPNPRYEKPFDTEELRAFVRACVQKNDARPLPRPEEP